MTKPTPKVGGHVLPAGTLQLGGPWDDGVYTVEIVEVIPAGDVFVEAKCKYEDGFTKFHQIKPDDLPALLTMVSNNVRGRHGVVTTVKKAPKVLREKEVIELEVKNDRS